VLCVENKLVVYLKKSIFILIISLKMNMRKLYLIGIACVLYVSVAAQTVDRTKGRGLNIASIDSMVSRLMTAGKVTGLGLGIIKDGKVMYVKSYGYKNKPKGTLNDTSTCFYAASLSKAVFAYLAMQLVDEGKLDLDKPLYQYLPKPLPEYEAYKDLAGDERWKSITGRMCLDHTTGFPNMRWFNPKGNQKLEIFFQPGSRFAYSGEGINLLQFIIEQLTGKQLETLAEERIFKPFGMTRTAYVWQSRFESDYANGHLENQDTIKKRRRSTAQGAGSMETTIADYTRFMAAVMRQESLSAKTWKEMLKPQIYIHSVRQFPTLDTMTTKANDAIGLSYGLGFDLFKSPYGQVFFKAGHDDGWEHLGMGVPGQKMAYVVMTNSSNGEGIFKELFELLSGVTIPWVWENYIPYNQKQ
jgi:CubicO group peptidase (beta-lactamase class C family)